MGFRRAATVTVSFPEGHELHGLEAVCRRMSVGHYLDIRDKERSDLDEAVEELAEALVSWNLENDKGKPVPATLAGVKTLDVAAVKAVFRAWLAEISGVPAPLAASSPNGGRPSIAEASIPMTPL